MVRSLEQVRDNIGGGGETVVDARGAGRFAGREKEPRPGVRSGHIPGSVNVPFTQVCGFHAPPHAPALHLQRRTTLHV